MEPLLYTSEQHNKKELVDISTNFKSLLNNRIIKRNYSNENNLACFHVFSENDNCYIDTNYFVGVDWLVADQAAIYVEPKLNDEDKQIDFLGMLYNCMAETENLNHIDGLYQIDFDKPWISIPQQRDLLTPILLIQFLKLVERIVRKGLRKSYYRISDNLNSRIKGKILVSKQIKENVVKGKMSKTYCDYQEYGINTYENQFINHVLKFISTFLSKNDNSKKLKELSNILKYCQPAFASVDDLSINQIETKTKNNVFFKEYEEAIKIGELILKRLAFNINKTSNGETFTPPFWVDMSKLFELYVFRKLKDKFIHPNVVTYHDSYLGGKETDILIRKEGFKCVIDCKYKPSYEKGCLSLGDKRQLAGYTRMTSVYNKLDLPKENLIKGVIIYSHQDCDDKINLSELFQNRIDEYVEFYKLGIKLPVVES